MDSELRRALQAHASSEVIKYLLRRVDFDNNTFYASANYNSNPANLQVLLADERVNKRAVNFLERSLVGMYTLAHLAAIILAQPEVTLTSIPSELSLELPVSILTQARYTRLSKLAYSKALEAGDLHRIQELVDAKLVTPQLTDFYRLKKGARVISYFLLFPSIWLEIRDWSNLRGGNLGKLVEYLFEDKEMLEVFLRGIRPYKLPLKLSESFMNNPKNQQLNRATSWLLLLNEPTCNLRSELTRSADH